MGYYIEIKMEPGTVPDRNSEEKAFENTGFTDRLELERMDGSIPDRSKSGPGREWVHLEQGFIASFYDKESRNYPGEWGEFRLSWRVDRERYLKILATLFAFAKQSSFRLYDPQTKKYIIEENLEESFEDFEKLAKRVKSFL